MTQRKAEGVRRARPPEILDIVHGRVLADLAPGRSMSAIAAELTAEGAPTAQGAKWPASTIRRVFTIEHARALS